MPYDRQRNREGEKKEREREREGGGMEGGGERVGLAGVNTNS